MRARSTQPILPSQVLFFVITFSLLLRVMPSYAKLSVVNSADDRGDHLISCEKQSHSSMEGLGIKEFLRRKSVLVTGSTGFLAKVFLEKLLRVHPDVSKVYCLIRAKDAAGAKARFRSEVLSTNLFNVLRGKYGTEFEGFISAKVVPVVGDLTQLDLGLHKNIAEELFRTLNILVNCSASTAFDERYDMALDINTIAPQRIVEFGKRCLHLHVFVQVSTAYVNGTRQGLILERPYKTGESIVNKSLNLVLNIEAEKEIAKAAIELFKTENLNGNVLAGERQLTQKLRDLGKARAKMFGWQDTYAFTKAMGEMVISSTRGELPVAIIRPTIIESTIAEPFPGWIQGNRVIDKVLVLYGKGRLASFPAIKKLVLDVVPADLVVNAIFAAVRKHAQQGGYQVYHISSSVSNPVLATLIADIASQSFMSKPYVNANGKAIIVGRFQLINSMHQFKCNLLFYYFIPFMVIGFLGWIQGVKSYKEIKMMIVSFKRMFYIADQYEPYVFFSGRFDNTNLQHLYDELYDDEKKQFAFDVRKINWSHYFEKIHLPSLRKYIMNEAS